MFNVWEGAHKRANALVLFIVFALGWLSISLWGDAIIIWLEELGVSTDNALTATFIALFVTLIFFGAMYFLGFSLQATVHEIGV